MNGVSKDYGETFSNQSHNEQILDLNDNEEQPEMPQQSESDKVTQNMFNISDHIWKGHVYEKKDHKREDERPIL